MTTGPSLTCMLSSFITFHSLVTLKQHYSGRMHLHGQVQWWLHHYCKAAHWLHDAHIANYLSKWKGDAHVNLLKLDVFASFFFVSPTKKLCLVLLPVTDQIIDGDVFIVGTLSNTVSTSKLIKINASAVGNIFVLLPANAPTGLIPKGPHF